MQSWSGVQKLGTQHQRGLPMTSSPKPARITAGLMLAFLGCVAPAFAQTATYTSFQVPGYTQTVAAAINNSFTVAGSVETNSGVAHGFVRDVSGKITLFDAPGGGLPFVSAINASGELIGFTEPSGDPAGFQRSSAGV